MKRSAYGDAFATPIHCLSESPRSCGLLTTMRRTFRSSMRFDDARERLWRRQLRRMAVDVDDRELGPRHRMLRDDERRLGLVLADVRNRELGLTARTRAGARSALPCWPCGACAMATAAAATRMNDGDEVLCESCRRHCYLGRVKRRSQPVSRILFPSTRRLATRLAQGNDHSSRPVIAHWLRRPTRWLGRAVLRNACASGRRLATPAAPPYLVLLRAGFCLPPTLPPARCALTAPFHPYPSTRRLRTSLGAVYFLCHCPSSCPARALPGALPFGVRTFLSPRHYAGTAVTGSSDRLADCDSTIISYCPRSTVSRLRTRPAHPRVSECELIDRCSEHLTLLCSRPARPQRPARSVVWQSRPSPSRRSSSSASCTG